MSKIDPAYGPTMLNKLFGKVPLLTGEDRQKYVIFQRLVWKQLKPKDLFEAISAREIAAAIWNGQRYKKLFHETIESKRHEAYSYLINPTNGLIRKSEKWLRSGLPDGISEAEFLEKIGLSPELVQAQTVILAAEDVSLLERMADKQVASQKNHVKDYERRRRTRRREKKKTSL